MLSPKARHLILMRSPERAFWDTVGALFYLALSFYMLAVVLEAIFFTIEVGEVQSLGFAIAVMEIRYTHSPGVYNAYNMDFCTCSSHFSTTKIDRT